MATQVKTRNEDSNRDSQPAEREEAGSGETTQRDDVKSFVDTLSQQFGEAIDPVLANLPQRMAQAIGAGLTKDGEEVARILPPTNEDRGDNVARAATATRDSESQARDSDRRESERRDAEPQASETRGSGRQDSQSQGSERRESASRSSRTRPAESRDSESREPEPRTYAFDPAAASRAELYRVAANWRDAGATYQAIHAYTKILERYPDSGAASAAVADLVNLAEAMTKEGMFYTAIGILDKVYQLT